jgi:hypothetical protein
MAVRKPLNIDDEDLTDASDLSGRASGEQTSIFCFLERIRLAEKMREVLDKNSLTAITLSTPSYEQVLEVDAIIASFLQDAPHSPLLETEGGNLPHSKSIVVQRHSLYLFLHGQRCRLHLPYLVRSAAEVSYDYSRIVALESACFIIGAETKLRACYSASPARFMLGGVLFSYFSAVAVLALDLCLTKQEEINVKQYEFKQAWRVLEEARSKVSIVEEGMQILEVMMRKHEVWPSIETGVCQRSATAQQQRSVEIYNHGPMAGVNPAIQQDYTSLPLDRESYIGQCDDTDWDILQWVIDMPFL